MVNGNDPSGYGLNCKRNCSQLLIIILSTMTRAGAPCHRARGRPCRSNDFVPGKIEAYRLAPPRNAKGKVVT
jgi:hypothetical protein